MATHAGKHVHILTSGCTLQMFLAFYAHMPIPMVLHQVITLPTGETTFFVKGRDAIGLWVEVDPVALFKDYFPLFGSLSSSGSTPIWLTYLANGSIVF